MEVNRAVRRLKQRYHGAMGRRYGQKRGEKVDSRQQTADNRQQTAYSRHEARGMRGPHHAHHRGESHHRYTYVREVRIAETLHKMDFNCNRLAEVA
jgi:hypothetical protein